mmetsp:Transcript_16171/g.29022  ORF Transcript_16171/g.29022 Transcript_16171/m.29022 type:complete len:218 (+) Transcript_16171:134-787(+)
MVVAVSPRMNSIQSTEINVPIDIVWENLSAFRTWKDWNTSLRFNGDSLPWHERGEWGKARLACSQKKGALGENKKVWMVVHVAFERVSREDYLVSWTMKRGFVRNTSFMKLTPIGNKRTLLTYSQNMHGPLVTFGVAHRKLMTNSSCVNQCFKNHVESLHFQNLLTDLSTREMTRSSATMESSVEEASLNSSSDFWQTPPHLRNEVVSLFVEEVGSR